MAPKEKLHADIATIRDRLYKNLQEKKKLFVSDTGLSGRNVLIHEITEIDAQLTALTLLEIEIYEGTLLKD
jgi:hypothetical protein